jgi:acyl-CoA reductase-like NAD-dependent aldehyde dehydrogenase
MSIAEASYMISRNPATGAELGRVAVSSPEEVERIVAQARAAQARWCATSWPERREVLRRWWRVLAVEADQWASAIVQEIGKPRGEAMAEVVATLDALRWTVQNAGRALRSERLGTGWQRWLLLPGARVQWRPIGVAAIIGTWNYPLYLSAAPIAHALAAGNAVVWKPSELAALAGERLQRGLEEAGVPAGLVAAVHGGADVGRELVCADVDKGVFTGGIENGRRVLAELARRGVPAVVELSGFDPAIVLPDAPVEPTVRSLTWSAFVGCGQTCVAVKRIYVVGDAIPFAEEIAAHARAIRVGDPGPGDVDMGPLISAAARERFERAVQAAIAAGARLLTGGAPGPGPGWFYSPTVLSADTARPETALAGCFGPVVIVRGVPSIDAAVLAANASPFGLAASVWGHNVKAARAVAERLEAGMVGVNEAVVLTALASAPFGGSKASGFGRVHGVLGLREFTQPRVVASRSSSGLRFQLFPYSGRLERLLGLYRRIFHPRS